MTPAPCSTRFFEPSASLAGAVMGYACRNPAGAVSEDEDEHVDYPGNLFASLVIVHRGTLRPALDAPLPRVALSGMRTGPSRLVYSAGLESTTVVFRPGRAFPLFGVSAGEFRDRFVDARDVLKAADHQELLDSVEAVHAPAERVAAIERFLAARLPRVSYRDQRLTAAMGAISGRLAEMSVSALTRHLNLTPKTLQRRCVDVYGAAAKPMLRILRTQAILKRLRTLPSTRNGMLAQIACDGGFADQSHLNRDFKAIVGMTPSAARDIFGSATPTVHKRLLHQLAQRGGPG